MRPQVEHLVEQRPTELEAWRVGEETPFRQLAPSVLADLSVPPVVLVVDETFLLFEQWVEHYQTRQFIRMLSSVVAADTLQSGFVGG